MPKRIPGVHFARNLVTRRTLLFQLVKRDFQQRYVGSAAGWLWGLIHPLVLLAIYTYIFNVCLKIAPPATAGTDSYAMYLFAGMLPWLLFSDTVQRASGSIVEASNLVTKTMFPSEIVPVSIFLSSMISHLVTVALFLAIAAIFAGHVSVSAVLLPLLMVPVGLLAVGIGWIVASLHVYLRDTAQVVAVMLTLWMWITPIMIAEKQIPERLRFILAINPMYYIVKVYRQMLLSNAVPSLRDVALASAFSVTAFVAGGLFFRHMKRGFADVL